MSTNAIWTVFCDADNTAVDCLEWCDTSTADSVHHAELIAEHRGWHITRLWFNRRRAICPACYEAGRR